MLLVINKDIDVIISMRIWLTIHVYMKSQRNVPHGQSVTDGATIDSHAPHPLWRVRNTGGT